MMLLIITAVYVILSSFRWNVRIGWLGIGSCVSAVLKLDTASTSITTTIISSDIIEIAAHFHSDKATKTETFQTEFNGIDRCYVRIMGHLLNWMVMEWQKIHSQR